MQIVRMVTAAYGPIQRIDRDDTSTAKVLGAFDGEIGGGFPVHLIFGFQFDTRNHGAVDPPGTPKTNAIFQRLDPFSVSDEAILAWTDFAKKLR